jgi:hypothetical protein
MDFRNIGTTLRGKLPGQNAKTPSMTAETLMDAITVVLDAALTGQLPNPEEEGGLFAQQLLSNVIKEAKTNPQAISQVAKQVRSNPGSSVSLITDDGQGRPTISAAPQIQTSVKQPEMTGPIVGGQQMPYDTATQKGLQPVSAEMSQYRSASVPDQQAMTGGSTQLPLYSEKGVTQVNLQPYQTGAQTEAGDQKQAGQITMEDLENFLSGRQLTQSVPGASQTGSPQSQIAFINQWRKGRLGGPYTPQFPGRDRIKAYPPGMGPVQRNPGR